MKKVNAYELMNYSVNHNWSQFAAMKVGGKVGHWSKNDTRQLTPRFC